MPNRIEIFKLVIEGTLIATTAPAMALTCGEKSPLFLELGDDYFNTDIMPLEDTVIPEVSTEQLFNALDTHGLETGHGEHSVCIANDAEAAPVTVPVTVGEIELESRLGEVYINALEVHPEDTDNHHVKIALSVQRQHVSVVNDNQLVEVIRQRRASSTDSQFEEIRLSLSRIETGIAVERLRYVNGELAEWLNWTLSP